MRLSAKVCLFMAWIYAIPMIVNMGWFTMLGQLFRKSSTAPEGLKKRLYMLDVEDPMAQTETGGPFPHCPRPVWDHE